jgi:YidC/Oxa1 family membrane protein insertase
MEKRAIVALVLSFVVFMAFLYLGEKIRRPAPPPAPGTTQVAKPAPPVPKPAPPVTQPAPAPAPPPAPVAARPSRPARDVVVETPLFRAVFTELGARLKSFKLKKYLESLPFTPGSSFHLGPVSFVVEHYRNPEQGGAKLKELIRPGKSLELPLSLSWEGKKLATTENLPCEASQTELQLRPGEQGTLKFTCMSPEGVAFTKTFTFKSDNYSFDLAVNVANHTNQVLDGSLALDLSENYSKEDASRFHFVGFNGSINHRWEEIKSGGLKEPKTFAGKVEWAGLDEGYFITAMIPEASEATVSLREKPKGYMVTSLKSPSETLPPGQQTRVSYTLYFGPKVLSYLKPLGMDRAVNFGWFDFLGKPLLYVLQFFEGWAFNYGWAIIILTILLRVVFFYPNHKSYKSMKDMQKLQPKVAKIREKHKDDKEAMNKELMALYRTFKVNPLAGCLPMVLQLPVFIALYNVLGYAIELRHASFIPTLPFTNIVWLADLSAKDPLLITPLIMGATMFIQQKMTPSPGDPTQAKMMMFLPLVFTFLFLNFASGLVIYWLVNNVLSIIQQHYTNKYLT